MFAGIIDGDIKYCHGEQLYTDYFPCNGTSYTSYDNNDDNDDNIWLFNLTNDPGEYYNLAKDNPDLIKKYQNMIMDFIQNGGYMPEQSSKFYIKASPSLHNGVWAPFLIRSGDTVSDTDSDTVSDTVPYFSTTQHDDNEAAVVHVDTDTDTEESPSQTDSDSDSSTQKSKETNSILIGVGIGAGVCILLFLIGFLITISLGYGVNKIQRDAAVSYNLMNETLD